MGDTNGMSQGKIKTKRETYGFITPDEGGQDLFFIPNELKNIEFDALEVGMRVVFDIEQHARGLRAKHITVI